MPGMSRWLLLPPLVKGVGFIQIWLKPSILPLDLSKVCDGKFWFTKICPSNIGWGCLNAPNSNKDRELLTLAYTVTASITDWHELGFM